MLGYLGLRKSPLPAPFVHRFPSLMIHASDKNENFIIIDQVFDRSRV